MWQHFAQLEINREAGTLGRGVPEISSRVVQNNYIILNLWYAVAYRAFLVAQLSVGAAHG
ncbi:hypothetical protein [Nitrosomonas europaea]|uniref:hypothetical protein n=1 Tax=Nitrosomonas europaea TaxID=915 RepID=UPI000795BA6E|nr:hypothetical protein [Nitrosomonas europaea]KXK47549.1 MAG: hypothetical protein UZ02_AOB001000691 [Nitrosomonas europaea]SDW95844.1 hypothetical protein SAMN05216310_16210 [Nitrosomonas europaea]SET48626.1 hypothetical protein SAMN05216309_16210 [Nitrosomonas europaea]SKA05009.1 hypothetical protein SAMN02745113_02586 [Nitrosomonas europaea]